MKIIAAVTLAALVLTGCNTVRGFGQDVSKVGDKVSDTASQ